MLPDNESNQLKLRIQSHLPLKTITGDEYSSPATFLVGSGVFVFVIVIWHPEGQLTFVIDGARLQRNENTSTRRMQSFCSILVKKSPTYQKFRCEKELFSHRNMLQMESVSSGQHPVAAHHVLK